MIVADAAGGGDLLDISAALAAAPIGARVLIEPGTNAQPAVIANEDCGVTFGCDDVPIRVDAPGPAQACTHALPSMTARRQAIVIEGKA